jgi:hypothetical protein
LASHIHLAMHMLTHCRRLELHQYTHLPQLTELRKTEDPRLSFSTPEFKDAQRTFTDNFKVVSDWTDSGQRIAPHAWTLRLHARLLLICSATLVARWSGRWSRTTLGACRSCASWTSRCAFDLPALHQHGMDTDSLTFCTTTLHCALQVDVNGKPWQS